MATKKARANWRGLYFGIRMRAGASSCLQSIRILPGSLDDGTPLVDLGADMQVHLVNDGLVTIPLRVD